MSDPDSPPPYVNGTLLLQDFSHARTVLQALGGKHADLVDVVFPPAPGPGEVFTIGSLPGFSGRGAEGIAGTIHIQTRPPAFAQPAVRAAAGRFLYTCAETDVTGYVEIDVPGENPTRTVHVLTPTGVYGDLVRSSFTNA